MDAALDSLYADSGRPSIAPEYLLRASILQILYSIRGKRALMEEIDFNILFRWFVGLGPQLAGVGPLEHHEEPGPAA